MKIATVSLIFLFCLQGMAQVTVEEEITTDSVNLFVPQQETDGKSTTLALMATLLVPGSGHHYLGRPATALRFFSIEALAISGLVISETYSKKIAGDASHYAGVFADIQGGKGADESYWQAVGQFMDSEGYNRVQELNRVPEEKYLNDELRWRWIDETAQDEYNNIREKSRKFHVAATFFAGTLVLNRIISFVELRTSSRKTRFEMSSLQLVPTYSSENSGIGFLAVTSF